MLLFDRLYCSRYITWTCSCSSTARSQRYYVVGKLDYPLCDWVVNNSCFFFFVNNSLTKAQRKFFAKQNVRGNFWGTPCI